MQTCHCTGVLRIYWIVLTEIVALRWCPHPKGLFGLGNFIFARISLSSSHIATSLLPSSFVSIIIIIIIVIRVLLNYWATLYVGSREQDR